MNKLLEEQEKIIKKTVGIGETTTVRGKKYIFDISPLTASWSEKRKKRVKLYYIFYALSIRKGEVGAITCCSLEKIIKNGVEGIRKIKKILIKTLEGLNNE